MSFEYSAASSMHDLLDKLRLFLIADGWTVNEWASDSQMYQVYSGLTAADSMRLHVQKDLGQSGETETCYVNFRSATRLVLFEDDYYASSTITPPGSDAHYFSEVRGVGMNMSTGYDGSSAGSNWDKQPGAPQSGTSNYGMGCCISELPSSGSCYYWFFSVGDMTYVVVEVPNSGQFQFLAFGMLQKAGSYEGGQFFTGSLGSYTPSRQLWNFGGGHYDTSRVMPFTGLSGAYGSTAIMVDLDGVKAWRFCDQMGSENHTYERKIQQPTNPPYYSAFGGSWPSAIDQFIMERSPNNFNGLCPMCRVFYFVQDVNARYSFIGHLDGMRTINCEQYEGGDSFQLGDSGSDVWYVFPQHQKGPDPEHPDDTYLNNHRGFAFLRQD